MKKLSFILTLAVAIFLAACSGGASYNVAECDALKEKISNKQELTEGDYNQMIDQLVGAAKGLKAKKDACGGDLEKEKELRKDEELKSMAGYAIYFALYLESHKKDLTPDNLKKLEKANEELKEIKL